MKKFVFAAPFLLAGLAGCGKPTVQATYVPFEKYEGLSCAQLAKALDEARIRQDELSRGRDADAKPDALSAIASGIGKLRGEQETEASAAQGDVNAITVAQIRSRCKTF